MAKITQDDLDAANASDDPIATLASRKEAKSKPKIVTKEQLAASGLSLRDYLNKERGLTRRDGSPVETTKSASTGSGRGGRGGPTADELDAYAKSKSVDSRDRIPGIRGKTNEIEGGDSASGSDLERNITNGLNALPGAATAPRFAKAAAKTAVSASRALAEKGVDEAIYLGKTAARKIEPEAERLTAAAKRLGSDSKRIATDDAERITNSSTKRLTGPEEEVAARDEVMRRSNWEDGPRGALGKAEKGSPRDKIFDRDFWTRGPSEDLKKGGKVKGYAKGGSVRGWGSARGARGAKII
jgi:hypothetical protein